MSVELFSGNSEETHKTRQQHNRDSHGRSMEGGRGLNKPQK